MHISFIKQGYLLDILNYRSYAPSSCRCKIIHKKLKWNIPNRFWHIIRQDEGRRAESAPINSDKLISCPASRYKMSNGLDGMPDTSQIVDASRCDCSRTLDDVAPPECIQYNSKQRILLWSILGKHVLTKRLQKTVDFSIVNKKPIPIAKIEFFHVQNS